MQVSSYNKIRPIVQGFSLCITELDAVGSLNDQAHYLKIDSAVMVCSNSE